MSSATARNPYSINLNVEEAAQVGVLVDNLSSRHLLPTERAFLDSAAFHAQSLPARLRMFLMDFKRTEPPQGYCVVSGFSVDERSLGATPHHWKSSASSSGTIKPSMYLVLVASILGEVFGWATKQNGAIVTDILPIIGDEDKQISSSSHQELAWHTEDSFQSHRCDYLVMLCLRNPDSVATTIGSIADVHLSSEDLELLFAPNFTILPDNSHEEDNNPNPPVTPGVSSRDLFAGIRAMADGPHYVSVLFGAREKPYLRIDPAYMGPSRNIDAGAALNRLITALGKVMKPVALLPGEILILNNFMTVHGRQAFKPRFDGTDRWFKRVIVTNDMRKSRSVQIPGTRLLR